MRTVIYIGPDKAGSSWLYETFKSHHEIALPRSKELFFFDRFYRRGTEWYLRQFQRSETTQMLLDISHDYMFDSRAPQRIRDFDEGAHLIVGLRDPIDRAVSSHAFMLSQGRLRSSFQHAVWEVDELLDHGRYGKHLSRWRECFPEDAFHFIRFDLLAVSAEDVASQLARSFGVSAPAAFEDGRVNAARVARLPSAVRVLRAVGDLARRVGRPEVVQWVKDRRFLAPLLFRQLRDDERVTVRDPLLSELRAELKSDVLMLDELFGLDMAGEGGYGAEP